MRARVKALLIAVAPHDEAVTAAAATSRLDALLSWANAALERHPSLEPLIGAVQTCRDLIAELGAGALTRTELRRLADVAAGGRRHRVSPQAGLASVPHPGAVLGPAETIIWWNFTRDSAPSAPRLRLSPSERAELEAQGLPIPDFGALMAGEARRWRRPFSYATHALVLVCPEIDETFERSFPHPLWDELRATLAPGHHPSELEVKRLELPEAPRRRRVESRALPEPATEIGTKSPLALRDVESPGSLEKLLGCSLAWALRYHARLSPGLADGPSEPSPLLSGTLAHHVLEQVFAGGARGPAESAEQAGRLVEAEIDNACESLRLPIHQGERATLRRVVVDSARELARIIDELGATVVGVEQKVERTLPEPKLAGYADMVLRDPDLVFDLKWGKGRYSDLLGCGAALQLAAYAELLKSDRGRPGVAYFSLSRQQLIAEPGTPLKGGEVPDRARAIDMWRGAMAALAARQAELSRGELVAPGADSEDGDPPEVGLSGEGVLTVPPPCDYCDFAGLCGRGGGQ